jgi:hypothetical protein
VLPPITLLSYWGVLLPELLDLLLLLVLLVLLLELLVLLVEGVDEGVVVEAADPTHALLAGDPPPCVSVALLEVSV